MHILFNARSVFSAFVIAGLSGAGMPAAGASSFATIYAAPAGSAFHPVVGLHSNSLLYGVDATGGAAGDGILFALDGSGRLSTVHSFAGSDGVTPNGRLALVSNVIYGTTRGGGATNAGGIFAINQSRNNSFTLLHSFKAATEGNTPRDGVAIDPQNGLLVGTTSMGAVAPGNGALFTMSTSGSFSVAWKFRSRADGHCPFTGVAIDGPGTIYGTTVGYAIGGNPMGSIWGLAPGGTIQTLYVFTDGPEGKYPTVTPTVDADGTVWGVSNTRHSQPYAGIVWKLTQGGGFAIVHTFNGGSDGFAPNSPLALGMDGNFYGTTASGGAAAGLGTFYRITPAGVFTVLHRFAGGADGGTPTANLTIDGAGEIFGGTSLGTIFRYRP